MTEGGAYIEESTDADWGTPFRARRKVLTRALRNNLVSVATRACVLYVLTTPQKRHFHMGFWTRTERPFWGIATLPWYGNGGR
jgi:hypothetical protein